MVYSQRIHIGSNSSYYVPSSLSVAHYSLIWWRPKNTYRNRLYFLPSPLLHDDPTTALEGLLSTGIPRLVSLIISLRKSWGDLWRLLRGSWGNLEGILRGIWRGSGGYTDEIWRVYGGDLEGLRRGSGGFMAGIWRGIQGGSEGIWTGNLRVSQWD